MENVEQRVKKIVAEQLGVNEAEIKNESSFVDDLGADSLDTVELVMALEEEFETEIPDDDAEKITTVQQAIDYVSTHLKKEPPPRGRAPGARTEGARPQRLARATRPSQFLQRIASTMSRRRVVVTGLGIVSPVGIGVDEAWRNIVEGRSGIGPITRFDASGFPSRIAGEVKGFDVSRWLSAKEARRYDTFIHYGLVATMEAVRDAGLDNYDGDKDRCGVAIGSGIGGLPLIEETHVAYQQGGLRKISPFFIPGSIINMAAGLASIHYGFRGPNFGTVSACSTGNHSIGEAARVIVYGDA